ncbi:hypothetical protein L2E82_44599 [Cichorium intybus]|uniref:Uncharacterized protein n=1 Tax=Cichorium intybus TaxID=13427 RepID=A0ACB8ZQS4_CICIN|nr:hypothetical protein L2E82_44599 [Cichorium intybus]
MGPTMVTEKEEGILDDGCGNQYKNTEKEFPSNYCYSTNHTSIFSRRRPPRRRGSLIPLNPRLTRSFVIQLKKLVADQILQRYIFSRES